jgi:hypothetical protein
MELLRSWEASRSEIPRRALRSAWQEAAGQTRMGAGGLAVAAKSRERYMGGGMRASSSGLQARTAARHASQSEARTYQIPGASLFLLINLKFPVGES